MANVVTPFTFLAERESHPYALHAWDGLVLRLHRYPNASRIEALALLQETKLNIMKLLPSQ